MKHFSNRFRLLTVVLMTAMALTAAPDVVSAQTAKGRQVTLNLRQVSVKTFFDAMKKQTGLDFLCSSELVKKLPTVTVDVKDMDAMRVIDNVMGKLGCKYVVKDGIVTVTSKEQDNRFRTVSGYVRDVQGETLPGAPVRIKGTNIQTTTDANGHFTLRAPVSACQIECNYIGMTPQAVALKSGQADVSQNLTLDSDNTLSEVVVTGYQTISKERATGAFDVLTPDKMKGKLQTNILSRLEGQSAGLVEQNGDFFIRGIATLSSSAKGHQPLIVVDGLPFEGDLKSINPSTIKNITILKDAAAASIYGAKAANGVIVISTIDGSESSKTTVRYDGTVKFTPKPDMGSLNLINSSELVDLQQYGFKFNTQDYNKVDKRIFINPVTELLLKNKAGLISSQELESGLNVYRGLDNRSQLEDFYARTGVEHQHNVSITGGSDKNRYAMTINYIGDYGNLKYQSSRQYGFTLRDNVKFFPWLKADVGVAGTFTRSNGDTGMGSYSNFYTQYPSYYMLRDQDGNPLNVPRYKSAYELERLRAAGLNDETYSPITNRKQEGYNNASNYYRVQVGLNFKITEGLDFDLRFQSENSNTKDRTLYKKNSYFVRSMVNDAAQYDSANDAYTLNVPQGGQLNQTRGDTQSYTLRAQLNFNREIGDHYVTALAGAERRRVKSSSTGSYYMGYDDNSLGYKPVNPLLLNQLENTEALGGSFSWKATDYNYLYQDEDRFVSFYANASYSYLYKYDLTGSIRIDQSNLFGTDPKYQYRPLWSLGASWHMAKENFIKENASWINNLTLRLTYGIGGNVSKDAGPYLTLYAPLYNVWVDDFGSQIKNPPNESLRWEKTATTNFGIDFAMLRNRLRGSLDIYNKRTTDLLANRDADPTLGFDQVMLNYGSMYNRGFELALNSVNVRTNDFEWATTLHFGYNKNKLINVDDSNVTVFNYTRGNTAAKDYPLRSVFSFRYAGLSEKGTPLYYTADGTEPVAQVTAISDLVYSGTRLPKYNGSLTNTFTYKNFTLSMMLVYYGGHVLRGEAAPYLSDAPTTNINREILNMWRQPGDEKNPNATPTIAGRTLNTERNLHPWYASDIHVVKADYIKLRDLSLTYSFDKSLISKLGMSALALTVQAQNLLTWKANDKGYDPEAMTTSGYGWGARALAIPATWTIGISANF